jgi:hypothetical protein
VIRNRLIGLSAFAVDFDEATADGRTDTFDTAASELLLGGHVE